MVKNHNRLGISDNLLNSVSFVMNNNQRIQSSEELNNQVNLYEKIDETHPHHPIHRFKVQISQDYQDGRDDAYKDNEELRKKNNEPKKDPNSHKLEKGKDGKFHLIRKASQEHVDFHNKMAKEHGELREKHVKEHSKAKNEVEHWTKQEKTATDNLRKVKREHGEESEEHKAAKQSLKRITASKHSAQARKDYHEGKAYAHGLLQMHHSSGAREYSKDYDTHQKYEPHEVDAVKKRLNLTEWADDGSWSSPIHQIWRYYDKTLVGSFGHGAEQRAHRTARKLAQQQPHAVLTVHKGKRTVTVYAKGDARNGYKVKTLYQGPNDFSIG